MNAKKSPATTSSPSSARSKPATAKGTAQPAAAKAPAKGTAKPAAAKAPGKGTAKPVVAKAPGKGTAKPVVAKAPGKGTAKPVVAKAPAKSTAKPSTKKGVAGKGAGGRQPAKKAEAAPAKPASPFVKGDKVVYPHHGAATITNVEKRERDGKKTDYFVLQVEIDSLILRVPVDRALELGVRPVISKTAARRVLGVFKTDPEEAGANWSRWYKLLTEKITSGDIYQVAEVVRDLTFAQQTKGISPALKRMLSKARLILTSELRFALELSEEEAMKRLDKSLPRVDGEELE